MRKSDTKIAIFKASALVTKSIENKSTVIDIPGKTLKRNLEK